MDDCPRQNPAYRPANGRAPPRWGSFYIAVARPGRRYGSQVKFSQETGSKACPSTGYYNFKRSGKTLTFAKLSDPKCAGRAFVLSHSFKFAG